MRKHHLVIFEGVEMGGKSALMARVYDELEKKYNQTGKVLDGCAWFNADVGVFGTPMGRDYIDQKIELLKVVNDRPVIVEKFHLSDVVYNRMHHDLEKEYAEVEDYLLGMGAKLVLVEVKPSVELFAKRLEERLQSVEHYERIAKEPKWYLEMNEEYLKEYEKSRLPKMKVDMTDVLNDEAWRKVMQWMGEA
jgi:thymidylate kinase